MANRGPKDSGSTKAGRSRGTSRRVSLSTPSKPQRARATKTRAGGSTKQRIEKKTEFPASRSLMGSPDNLSSRSPQEAIPEGPALGMVELGSVSRGMVVADAMCKKALVHLLQAHPVTPGKYVVLVTGGEEEVALAIQAGVEVAADTLVDRLFLPLADPQLLPAIHGQFPARQPGALGIVETFSVASTILAADKAVKAADVQLVQMRLARGLGGRAYFVLCGELPNVEAAIEVGRSIIYDGMLFATEIIARPHGDLMRTLLEVQSDSRTLLTSLL